MLQILTGQWFLTFSNFSMWKHDDISDVTFNYTAAEKDGKPCFLDKVKYKKAGKSKSISGYDFADEQDSRSLIWQGKGWMFWIKSYWKIEWISEAQDCIVLSFKKTIFTASGVDIITRQKFPAPDVTERAKAYISSSPDLQQRAKKMFRILQN